MFLRLSLLLLTLLLATPAAAQPSGISYGASPIGERVFWSGDAGLEDGFFYGGALGFGLGRYLEVNGTYLLGNNLQTDFSRFEGESPSVNEALAMLPSREVDVQRYGGRLRVHLSQRGLAPYLSLGAGALRFEPANRGASEHIYATTGAGLTLSSSGRYTLSAGGQFLIYRYSPAHLLSDADLEEVGQPASAFSLQTVYNPAARAALSIYLGGRPQEEQTALDHALRRTLGPGSARFSVEPFYGQIEFNSALSFPERQPLTGVQAGLKLGPYVGLRGFYWRGTEDETLLDDDLPNDFADVQFYGGDLVFRLETAFGRGFVPFLTLGGGYADALSGYEGRNLQPVEDRFFGLGGGGLEIPVSQRLRLNAGVRSVLMSNQDVEDVSEPSSVHGSLMYTVGLEFNLGRRGTARTQVQPEATRREEDLAALRARIDSLDRAEEARSALRDELRERFADDQESGFTEAEIDELVELLERRGPASTDEETRSNLSEKTMTIPVPEQGEIYMRFGPLNDADTTAVAAPPPSEPVGSAAQIRQIVRQTIRDELAAQDDLSETEVRRIIREQLRAADPEAVAALETERLLDRIDRLEERLDRRREGEGTRFGQTEDREQTLGQADRPTLLGQELRAAWPYTGLRLGEGPTQIVLGVRGDYRSAGDWFRLLPEAALGFGGAASIHAMFNAAAPIPFAERYTAPWAPYLGMGLGLVSERGLVGLEPALNLMLGAEYPFRYGVAFSELSTVGLFDFTRLVIGYRLTL